MKRAGALLLALVLLMLPLAACGKKGPPKPLSGKEGFPREYPRPN